MIPFRDELLCIRGTWSIKDFETNADGNITDVRVKYTEDEYYHQEVEVLLPMMKVWVLNHQAIINKLREKNVPRAAWHGNQSEWEYQALQSFHNMLDWLAMEHELW